MKNYVFALLAGVALMFGVSACSNHASTNAENETIATEIITSEGAVILDVRSPEEFAAGHLEGAELLDWNSGEFAANLGSLDKNADYLVYCRSGNRSSQAVDLMIKEGFTNVTDLGALENAAMITELPVEKG